MMARIAQTRGDGKTGWYLRDGLLLFDSLWNDLHEAVAQEHPVCIAATAFALVHLLEAMEAANLRVRLPNRSRVMETGGFKGRTREVSREDLYRRAGDRLGIAGEQIVAEYGMTELTSQYYDRSPRRDAVATRRKILAALASRARRRPRSHDTGAGRRSARCFTWTSRIARRASRFKPRTSACGADDGFVLLGRAT